MASKPSLRAVAPDEKAPSKKATTKTVAQAAESGTERELLEALLLRVAKDIENANTPAVALAALTRRALDIRNDLEALKRREAEEAEGAGVATPDEAWEVG